MFRSWIFLSRTEKFDRNKYKEKKRKKTARLLKKKPKNTVVVVRYNFDLDRLIALERFRPLKSRWPSVFLPFLTNGVSPVCLRFQPVSYPLATQHVQLHLHMLPSVG